MSDDEVGEGGLLLRTEVAKGDVALSQRQLLHALLLHALSQLY